MSALLKLCSAAVMLISGISAYAETSENLCKIATRNSKSLMEVNMNLLATVNNMLPIKMGKATLLPALKDTPTTVDDNMNPVCVCDRVTPIGIVPLPGLALSFWNSVGLVDTTSIPYCFPSLGTAIPIKFGADMSYGARSDGAKNQLITAQTHFTTANILGIVNSGLSSMCLQVQTTTVIDHISELMPWWQDDKWSVVFAPESLLVANPIAQSACLADALSSIAYKPLDVLYWCYGSWGSSYPQTVTVGSGDAMTSFANLAARTTAAQFKTLKLLNTTGSHMLKKACQPIPSPMMRKTTVNIFPIYPSVWSKRLNIGSPAIRWSVGKDNPSNMGVMVWAVYQKRDCCLL